MQNVGEAIFKVTKVQNFPELVEKLDTLNAIPN